MESSLESVLNGQATETTTTEVQQPETVQEQPQEVQQAATGEEAASPAEPRQEDPIEKRVKGLEAAAAAERKRRQEAEQRAFAYEQQLRSMQQPQQPRQQPTDDGKPLRSQFATEDEWLDARDAWRDQKREREAAEARQLEQARAVKQKTDSVLAEAMKLEGFDLRTFADLPVSNAMADAVLDSEVAPRLVHYLTTNPAEAYRIAALPEARQIKELARIEDRLTVQPSNTEEAPQRDKPRLPQTLTQQRDARGRFEPAYTGPKPLTDILK